jgi:hypothetical protein
MLQWAVAEARARGCKLVELLTHQTRVDARRFYERPGFRPSHVGMTLTVLNCVFSVLMNVALATIAKRVLPFVPVNGR